MAASTLHTTRLNTQTRAQTAVPLTSQPVSVKVMAVNPSPAPVRRLVVLIPSFELDEVEVARRVWDLASLPHLAVMYIALCQNAQDEPRLRRSLATLSALTRDDRIAIETRLEYGHDWRTELSTILRDDDVLVCQAGHTVGWRQKPIAEMLNEIGAPIWILEGLSMVITKDKRKSFKEILFWPVSLAVILGFLWLQIRLLDISEEWVQNILLYLSLPAEIGLLWLWHIILA